MSLKKFKELKLGGENTIPATESLYNAYFPNYEYREYPLSEEDNAMYSDITVASLTYDATKQKLKYMNQLYNDGLISLNGILTRTVTKSKPILYRVKQACSDSICHKILLYFKHSFKIAQTQRLQCLTQVQVIRRYKACRQSRLAVRYGKRYQC